jgi:signal transduction histidine kinase/ActR/RegA family two-component response regulator
VTSVDPLLDPRVTLAPEQRSALERTTARATLAVPLLAPGRVLGVLVVRAARPFDRAAIELAEAFADQAVVALESARLYQETTRAYEELARTQAQLVQSQKMEAMGRLAGGVAHDFNNLLTVVVGRSELLLSRAGTGSDAERQLRLVQQAALQAGRLTQQLLAFSRKQVLQPKVIDLRDLVVGIAPMLRRLIGEDVDLTVVRHDGIGRVQVDSSQLEQVILNLVVNARDAMPDGGRLTIEVADTVLDAAYASEHVAVTPGPYVMLAVTDTGVGMDAETQARIFEPFFTTKEPGRGTGLGLSTVYGIIKQSGGNIWVYSEPGRGTTFKVYLPQVLDQPTADRAEAPTAPIRGGQETVLLVEDEASVRELAREALEMSGYTVLEAQNGGAALLVAEQYRGPIDAILTDVVMPEMSGPELVRRLVGIRPEIRVVYMSGYTGNTIERHGLLDPGTVFLPKPFSPRALATTIRAALDRSANDPE